MALKLPPTRRNVLALIADGKVRRGYGNTANGIAWCTPDHRSVEAHIRALVGEGLIETPDTALYAVPVLTDLGRATLEAA